MKSKLLKSFISIIMTICFVVSGLSVNADPVELKNTISVSGEAVIKAKPDVAYITVGAQTENKNSKIAQQDNAKKMSEIYKALEKLKVSKDMIKTESYSIYPVEVYSEKDKRYYISTYRVVNNINVTINDLNIVGEVIDAASQNGANQISNITFGIKDTEEYYLQALEAAAKKAKKKADVMAKTFGIKLDAPTQINENSSYQPYYTRNYASIEAKSDNGYVKTPVSAGELEIRASVSMLYKY